LPPTTVREVDDRFENYHESARLPALHNPAVVRLKGCLLAEAVHAFLELLYDIAVEVRGVQAEQGSGLTKSA
jgi:hypothetical protein